MFRSLASQLGSMIIALVLAATVWVVATGEENPSREAFFPDPLTVEFVNVPDGMMVYKNSPTTVSVKLRAPQASWDQLRPGSFHVVADLSSLEAGDRKVKLKVEVDDTRVSVTDIEPTDTVDVQLEKVISRQLDVRSEVLDVAPTGYVSRSPIVTPAQVTVTGPEILVNRVNEVVADVYLREAKTSIDREVTAVPRDSQGNTLQDLTVSPAIVDVKVQVDQRVGFKDVSIRTVLKGAPAPGYWVSNITVNPSSATIVGSPDTLGKIAGFVETAPIDITGATADVGRVAALSLPQGVSILNNEGITVQVSITPILGGQTIKRQVTIQGLARGLTATASPDSVDVILSGPVPSLQSLAPEDVQVVVDGSTLTPGTSIQKPKVISLPESLRVQSIVPDSVQVTVSGVVTPTLPSIVVTPSATRTITGTSGAASPGATPGTP
ncbi:MAG: CdaR family protein [Chloroflexi bacterium]|nr:CdaR family protein [Chloroflexota bacterium]